jgi:hypothetical protein
MKKSMYVKCFHCGQVSVRSAWIEPDCEMCSARMFGCDGSCLDECRVCPTEGCDGILGKDGWSCRKPYRSPSEGE